MFKSELLEIRTMIKAQMSNVGKKDMFGWQMQLFLSNPIGGVAQMYGVGVDSSWHCQILIKHMDITPSHRPLCHRLIIWIRQTICHSVWENQVSFIPLLKEIKLLFNLHHSCFIHFPSSSQRHATGCPSLRCDRHVSTTWCGSLQLLVAERDKRNEGIFWEKNTKVHVCGLTREIGQKVRNEAFLW